MYHSKLCYISYVPQFEPLILGVKMLHSFLFLAQFDIAIRFLELFSAKATCVKYCFTDIVF